MLKSFSLAVAGAALLGGCMTGPRTAPVDVTRYHLGQPLERTSVAVEPMNNAVTISPEYQLYADAVAAELARQGYVATPNPLSSGYIAAVSFSRAPRGAYREQPPVSIGLGGGSYGGGRRGGGGVGLGGGVSFGIGGKTREVTATELWVQLKRRSDNTVVWEGRAQTQSVSGTKGSDPRNSAARVAAALFKGFPGESGITITVK
ncbi:DUF4136 domain-containing protein [Sphingomonas sp. MMS12-HWE2-04]|uniref:DUF4136 domain-containing protein n=1 Tax=Sphingomonas sp. MMS12-HWE2-04 TaxID=3234199 RepID=UPI00385029EF